MRSVLLAKRWVRRGNSWSIFVYIVPPNNPVDLQSLKLIDFHLLRWSAQQRLFTVLRALTKIPEVIRWIHPSTPGMAISADGRWLFLAATNYAASSSDYFLQTFDTRQGRLLPEKKPISRCAGFQILPLAGDNSAVVLCREEAGPKEQMRACSGFQISSKANSMPMGIWLTWRRQTDRYRR
jgi:hypothetical protein